VLQRPGVAVEPRKMWPSGMATFGSEFGTFSGKIPAGQQFQVGRAIARLDGIGWGTALRDLLAPEVPDGELPVPLRYPMADVLDSWLRGQSSSDSGGVPDGVIYVESMTRPLLVSHIAAGASRILKIPVLGRLVPRADQRPSSRDVNSAQRLRAVADRFTIAADQPLDGLRVLLVDDRSDSGWTLAAAARLIRKAGAGAVLPFVLGVG
jgi:ATP-dependent DNA helicase RecQ